MVTVSSLLQSPSNIKVTEVRLDWDKATVMMMYTTRNGESKVVRHTNKSLIAQVFSPKGTSNNWFDQNVSLQGFTMYFLSEYSDTDLITALDDTKVPNAVLYPWQVWMLSQSSLLEVHDLSQLRVIVTGGAILGPTPAWLTPPWSPSPTKRTARSPRGFIVLKSGHEETEENLINFLESRLQDHERLRGGLLYIQQIPQYENWKVVKSVLQAIKPPAKYKDSSEKVETLKEDAEADSVLSTE